MSERLTTETRHDTRIAQVRRALEEIATFVTNLDDASVEMYADEVEQMCPTMTHVQSVNWAITLVAQDIWDHLYLEDDEDDEDEETER